MSVFYLYYCFVKLKCILFCSFNTVIVCKSSPERVSGKCGVAKECCVFLRRFNINILSVVLAKKFCVLEGFNINILSVFCNLVLIA